MWGIAVQQLRHAVNKMLPEIVAGLVELIGSPTPRFVSSTIEYEAMAAFGTLLAHHLDC